MFARSACSGQVEQHKPKQNMLPAVVFRTDIGLTIALFLLAYGSYFLATYLSCKRIVTEQRELAGEAFLLGKSMIY